MGAQGEALVAFRAKILHQPRPQQTRGAQFGHFHEEIHADGEEEGEAGGEDIDVEPAATPARTYSTPSASV